MSSKNIEIQRETVFRDYNWGTEVPEISICRTTSGKVRAVLSLDMIPDDEIGHPETLRSLAALFTAAADEMEQQIAED